MGYLDEAIRESKQEVEEQKKEEEKAEEEKKDQELTKEEIKEKQSQKAQEEADEIKKQEAREVKIEGEKEVVTKYGNTVIYKVKEEPLLFYSVPVTKPSGPEKRIVNTIKEAATRLIMVSPEQFRSMERRRKFYFNKIKEIIESNPEIGLPETKIEFYSEMVTREMIGYGVIDALVRDKMLEEVMVVGPNKPVFVFHQEYGMMKSNVQFGNNEEIREIIERIARQVGRRIDRKNPLLDARLPDGSRVNATIQPISLDGHTLTIRKFREDPITITDLIKWKTLTPEVGAFFWLMAEGMGVRPANTLVSGGTASGKTTTLNVLSSFIPIRERIITIEQTAELNLPIEHMIRMETRPPGMEGKGKISMGALVENSLRMRPDRILVGEVRGEEAYNLFQGMNTGHNGCMGTIHANSAKETITRVTSPPMNVPVVMANALDFIIIQKRIHKKKTGLTRRITSIAEVQEIAEDGSAKINILYTYDPAEDKLKRERTPSIYEQKILRYTNITKEDLEKELQERKEVLENLVKRNITNLDEVKRIMGQHMVNKDG